MKRSSLFFTAVLFFSLSSVFAFGRRPGTELQEPSLSTAAAATPEAESEAPVSDELKARALFLVPHREGKPEKIIEFLQKHPGIQLTIIFPPHYFDAEPHRSTLSGFAALQSSKQIEIGLSMENEPILPLLGNLQEAGPAAVKWGIDFEWPQDIAAQIARSSGKYQKRWGALPSGLFPPHQALSEKVMDTAKRFRLNWVLGKPNEISGVKFYGGTALLISSMQPEKDELVDSVRSWAEKTSDWVLTQPFALVNAALVDDPTADVVFLETLNKAYMQSGSVVPFVSGQEFVDELRHEFELPDSFDPFIYDYSAWVATPQQKRAWAALADARKVIEAYQRSGRANLQRLDAATEEMCNVESGEFLLALAQGPSANSMSEKNFLATIGNIYRLCDAPLPPNLNTWFAARTWTKTSAVKSIENDRPFFVEGPQSLTWNDPKTDDNGAGKLVYPAGRYPKGMFDLREFTVTWTDTDVTLSVSMLEPFSEKAMPVVPLVDVYIDVNRLSDAGSTTALRRRGTTVIPRDAAWEFAVALSPATAVLYQSVPGSNPRVVKLTESRANRNTISATFSRKTLRGDPRRWRLSIGLMGTENSRRQEEPTPSAILGNAGEKNFGGASSNRVTPFIDILAGSVEEQTQAMSVNDSGGPLTLPYVEAQ